MTRRLRRKYNLLVGRHTVRSLLKNIDPHGVHQRRQRRFERKQYRCPGPNAVWHIDGYDKLALSGFCISGCIDGYSRRIMFLQVASTNHDPWILGGVSNSGTCFWILGRVSDSGKCFGFWDVFLDSGKRFGFWDMFLNSGNCFGFWTCFWILGSVLDSGKCFGFWDVFLDSGKCFRFWDMFLDSGNCFGF